jgi:hypothetical protein
MHGDWCRAHEGPERSCKVTSLDSHPHAPATARLRLAALTRDAFGGGWGATVETMEQLEAALTTAKSTRGLSLIDVRIPQDAITPQMLLQAGGTPPVARPASARRHE